MGSLLEEPARLEAAAQQRIEELGERIAELNGLLEVEEDRLSRLVITREAVQEVLGETARPVEGPAEQDVSVQPVGVAVGAVSPVGVLTVPPWRPGMGTSVLPVAYRDAVEILADAAGAMRAGQVAAAMGLIVAEERREGYCGTLFRHWIDADRDGCDTRREVLLAEAVQAPRPATGAS